MLVQAWKAKCHEGYAEVSYEDVWSLDTRLARIIANHLRAFLKAEKGPYGGTPGNIVEKYGEDKGYAEWLNIIRRMIYAFEEYSVQTNGTKKMRRSEHVSGKGCNSLLTITRIYGYNHFNFYTI